MVELSQKSSFGYTVFHAIGSHTEIGYYLGKSKWFSLQLINRRTHHFTLPETMYRINLSSKQNEDFLMMGTGKGFDPKK